MTRSLALAGAAAVSACLLLSACNLITGAESLDIDEDGWRPDGGGRDDTELGAEIGPDTWRAVDGVTLDQIALYQAVKRPIMQAGEDVDTNVPLIAGRSALLRIFYSVHPEYNGQPVTAILAIGEQSPLGQSLTVQATSSDEDLASTVNFEVPAEMLAGETDYRIDLLQSRALASGANDAAGYPKGAGHAPLWLDAPTAPLRVVLVPVAYGADGSQRMPDLSPEQIGRFRDGFLGTYPISELDLQVGPSLTWDGPVDAEGDGWEPLLDALMLHREQNAAPDEYYYGLIEPADSLGAYCAAGCVAGLSALAGPEDAFARAAVGVGFPGVEAVQTALHETGHMHGRKHAPCAANGDIDSVDSSFPYPGGAIGPSGYDPVTGSLKPGSTHRDFMAYCAPAWISDYTFAALSDRIRRVSGAAADPMSLDPGARAVFERVSVRRDGQAVWLEPFEQGAAPEGEPIFVEALVGGLWRRIEGRQLPRSALGGSLVVFRKPQGRVDAVRVPIAGELRTASRPKPTQPALRRR